MCDVYQVTKIYTAIVNKQTPVNNNDNKWSK